MSSSTATQRRFYTDQPSPSVTSLLSEQQTSSIGSLSNSPSIQPQLARGLSNASTYSFQPSDHMNPPRHPSGIPSISDKYSLSHDVQAWGTNLSPNQPEADDDLHNPDPRRDRKIDTDKNILTSRGLANLGCLFILAMGLITLFAGYPIISFFTTHKLSTLGGFNIGGINATGQVSRLNGNWGLVDLETPDSVYNIPSYHDPKTTLQLVFSDEFNTDGRSFYPGDDPYWEAVDLHYWGTNNLEWYDPAAVTTKNGALEITLSKMQTHNLSYQGGMISSWNKFCFTGGLIQTAVTLPGAHNILGLWPAVWTMGNLGRAGYGASLDGTWPYSYDACDVGTAKNQTVNGLPVAATVNGDPYNDGALSYLPGQRLSRCTCPGESHPGPVHSDGTYVGRAACEIDIFEAQIRNSVGQVSQSGQWAPFNEGYLWFNTTDNYKIYDDDATTLNDYLGGAFQQATSGVTDTDQNCYELGTGCFSVYGFEYKPGFDGAYIDWISNNKLAWSIYSEGLAADTRVEISARPVPQEPLYIIANLGMSENFGVVDFEHLTFPTTMRIDYIRVYQDPKQINIGCDPENFPTAAYIQEYIEAYTNPLLTTWVDDYKQTIPKSSLLGQC
ncbi:beta-glucan synthesis-associated [Mycena floridula]|nr:beta-glucan synthesis-associated [Mycena floridula]